MTQQLGEPDGLRADVGMTGDTKLTEAVAALMGYGGHSPRATRFVADLTEWLDARLRAALDERDAALIAEMTAILERYTKSLEDAAHEHQCSVGHEHPGLLCFCGCGARLNANGWVAAPSPSDGPLPHDEPELHRIVTGDAAPSGERGAPPPPSNDIATHLWEMALRHAEHIPGDLMAAIHEACDALDAVEPPRPEPSPRTSVEGTESRGIVIHSSAPTWEPSAEAVAWANWRVGDDNDPMPSNASELAAARFVAGRQWLSRATVAAALRDAWRLADGERAFSALRVVAETLGIPPEEGKE